MMDMNYKIELYCTSPYGPVFNSRVLKFEISYGIHTLCDDSMC